MLKPYQVAHRAIKKLVPNADCTIGETYESIGWSNESRKKPTKAEFDTAMASITAEYDALEYARTRQAEYPDWGTQLNKIYDDGIDKWKTEMVDPVKAKHPKP